MACTSCKKSSCSCSQPTDKRVTATIADIRATVAILNAKINDALREIDFSDLQDVTNRDNVTNNYIVLRTLLAELSPNDLIKIYNSLSFMKDDNIGKIVFNSYFDQFNPVSIELSDKKIELHIEEVLSLAVAKDKSRFGTRVSGSNAIDAEDFVTLQQMTSFVVAPVTSNNITF